MKVFRNGDSGEDTADTAVVMEAMVSVDTVAITVPTAATDVGRNLHLLLVEFF
jgi:hypothetical protein